MIIDIVFALFVLLAFYNGYKKGIIHSVLSFVAIFIGILLAMNFSSVAAAWLSQSFQVPAAVMPVLSFILVVIAVIVAIKIVAWIVERVLKAILLNFVNRLAGGALWAVLAALLFSVGLWLLNQTGIFTDTLKADSIAFNFVMPYGPIIFDFVGDLLPLAKNAFFDLNETTQNATAPAE